MKSKNKFVLGLLVTILMISATGLAGADAGLESGQAPQVFVDAETWQGTWYNDDGQYAVFRGIPYAAPPTGDGRWRPPTRRTPEPGIHTAKANGPACIQTQRLVTWDRNILKAYGLDDTSVPDLMNISEDCLYLNVWTPTLEDGENLPVMLWIYGGSNRSGWAHQVYYQGASLAKRGVVSVFINYRVGVFGWMSHPALSKESADRVSGNYGILDQVAALEWVKRNISRFGGDPDKVTIAGESAGGANVATLLASPLAKGLFKRAIIQSGGFPGGLNLEKNEALGTKIMTHLGVSGAADSAQTLIGMRALGAEDVLTASNAVRGRTRYGPVVDGHVLTASTLDIYGQKTDHAREVMIGVNAHEFSLFLPRTYAANEDGMPGEKEYNQALTYYADDEDGARSLGALLSTETDLFRRMERLSSTGYFLCPSNAAARKLARSGHDVYFYYFTRVREGQQQWMGAHHAAELPYIFDTGNRVFPSNATDIALTEAMGDYWANFMASGDPNGKGLAQWPVFKPDTGQYMNLGDEFLVGENLESELCGVMPNAY